MSSNGVPNNFFVRQAAGPSMPGQQSQQQIQTVQYANNPANGHQPQQPQHQPQNRLPGFNTATSDLGLDLTQSALDLSGLGFGPQVNQSSYQAGGNVSHSQQHTATNYTIKDQLIGRADYPGGLNLTLGQPQQQQVQVQQQPLNAVVTTTSYNNQRSDCMHYGQQQQQQQVYNMSVRNNQQQSNNQQQMVVVNHVRSNEQHSNNGQQLVVVNQQQQNFPLDLHHRSSPLNLTYMQRQQQQQQNFNNISTQHQQGYVNNGVYYGATQQTMPSSATNNMNVSASGSRRNQTATQELLGLSEEEMLNALTSSNNELNHLNKKNRIMTNGDDLHDVQLSNFVEDLTTNNFDYGNFATAGSQQQQKVQSNNSFSNNLTQISSSSSVTSQQNSTMSFPASNNSLSVIARNDPIPSTSTNYHAVRIVNNGISNASSNNHPVSMVFQGTAAQNSSNPVCLVNQGPSNLSGLVNNSGNAVSMANTVAINPVSMVNNASVNMVTTVDNAPPQNPVSMVNNAPVNTTTNNAPPQNPISMVSTAAPNAISSANQETPKPVSMGNQEKPKPDASMVNKIQVSSEMNQQNATEISKEQHASNTKAEKFQKPKRNPRTNNKNKNNDKSVVERGHAKNGIKDGQNSSEKKNVIEKAIRDETKKEDNNKPTTMSAKKGNRNTKKKKVKSGNKFDDEPTDWPCPEPKCGRMLDNKITWGVHMYKHTKNVKYLYVNDPVIDTLPDPRTKKEEKPKSAEAKKKDEKSKSAEPKAKESNKKKESENAEKITQSEVSNPPTTPPQAHKSSVAHSTMQPLCLSSAKKRKMEKAQESKATPLNLNVLKEKR